MRNLWKTHVLPIWWSTPQDESLMRKRHPYYVKVWVPIFQVLPLPGYNYSRGLVAFSHVMGNWWEKQCIFHMMKHTTGWESNGKKVPTLWEKYEYQFLRLFPIQWVLLNFQVLWKSEEETHTFPTWWSFNWQGNLCISHMMK